MDGKKIALITGANTGLGYQIIRALADSDQAYEILLGGRSIDKAQTAAESARTEFPNSKSNIRPVQIDISDDKSIDNLFNLIKGDYDKIDTMINNAGIYPSPVWITADGSRKLTIILGIQLDQQWMAGNMSMRGMWSESWNLNVVSTNVITHHFVPLLLNSNDPRLVFMASGTSSLANSMDPALAINKSPPKGWPKDQFTLPAYRSAKTGMNMMMRYVLSFDRRIVKTRTNSVTVSGTEPSRRTVSRSGVFPPVSLLRAWVVMLKP
jgi:NAD(P)-dependent dehydrogenase (short-subunit alcohol dehydrogenase family)